MFVTRDAGFRAGVVVGGAAGVAAFVLVLVLVPVGGVSEAGTN